MGILVSFLLVLGLTYFVFLDAQKRGVKREYLWVMLSFFIPIFGFIIYIVKRPKEVINNSPNKIPYGFRSKSAWKMITATAAYLLIFLFSIAMASSSPSDIKDNNLKTIPVTNSKKEEPKETEKKAENQTKTVTAEETKVNPGQKLKVHYIDVGQADSILIQIPNGKNVLIDAGNNADSGTVVSYLQNQGVKRLDVVIGTHPHEDHIGSLDTVINTFDIGQVVMPKASSNTTTYKDVVAAINNKGLKITEAKAGLKFELGSEVITDLIAPNGSNYEDINNYSAVLKLVYGKNTFLFDGDAEDVSENEILNGGYNIKADVLKIGHHGSSSSTSQAFLSKVSPKYAIISVGKGNSYGHPTQTTLDKLTSAGINIYRTDENGTVIAESDGTNITFQTVATSVQPRAPDQSSQQPIPQPPPVVTNPAPSNSDVTVFITNTGKKYHRDGCRYLSKSKIPISLSAAKNQGYDPCSVCNPPQ